MGQYPDLPQQTTVPIEQSITPSKAKPAPASTVIIIDEDEDESGNNKHLNDDEEHEIELWNDDVGFLLSDPELDAVTTASATTSPPHKRQRTRSPEPLAVSAPPSLASMEQNVECPDDDDDDGVVHVDYALHLLGYEEGMTCIFPTLDGLLIFCENKDPVLWDTPNGTFLVSDGTTTTTIHKRMLRLSQALEPITAYHASRPTSGKDTGKRKKNRAKSFIGTRTGRVFVIDIQDMDNTNPTLSLTFVMDIKEPVQSLFTNKSDGLEVLTAVGSLGNVFEAQLDERWQEGNRESSVVKLESPVRNAFYTERLETPTLCALTSTAIPSKEMIFGLNSSGQILKFSSNLDKYFCPMANLAIREGISSSLNELEQLTQEIKALEKQCQLENQ
ncbi:hypothetical protein BGZ94_004643, partial [Podila epigama]